MTDTPHTRLRARPTNTTLAARIADRFGAAGEPRPSVDLLADALDHVIPAPQKTAGEAVAYPCPSCGQEEFICACEAHEKLDYMVHPKAHEAAIAIIVQAITDPENQPSQWGTVLAHPTPSAATTDNTALVEVLLQIHACLGDGRISDGASALRAWRIADEAMAALASRPDEATSRERVEAAIEALKTDPNLERPICCNGVDCGCQGIAAGEYAAMQLQSFFERAALTPKASDEGEKS